MGAPVNIQDRAMGYALRAVALFEHLDAQPRRAGWVLGKQYLRSATSIGANMVEAQAGESRADFIHKCGIAQKEARESLYWLNLLLRAEIVPEQRLRPLIAETDELIAIITAIIVKTKRRNSEC